MLIILFVIGSLAGFINTLAGGGSILVLPVLIMYGIPSPVANATIRIAILFQNLTGTYRFHKHGKLKVNSVKHITIATIIGAIIGSLLAVQISTAYFDKILGFVFIIILILMLKPHKKKNKSTNKLPKVLEFAIFLVVGFYGGFVQVGIGFILLATLNLVEDFDLIQANAVKVFIVLCYTVFAVIVFATNGKIYWKYGLTLAAGSILGAYIGVKAAITKGEKIIKIVLTLAVFIASLKLFGVFNLIGF